MKNTSLSTDRWIGLSLLVAAVGILIPYTLLTIIFEYPDILRQDIAEVLTKFHEGGARLVWTWFAFALAGLPLIPAYILIGQKFEAESTYIRWATTVGIIGLIVQLIGLLRWTFVVPVLVQQFINGDSTTQEAVKVVFAAVHQFGGVLLGEHIGQLFTIVWTVMIARALQKYGNIPAWTAYLAYLASVIYLLAQAELLATVIPTFPVWDLAGFLGSTLWLLWLIVIGIFFVLGRVTVK